MTDLENRHSGEEPKLSVTTDRDLDDEKTDGEEDTTSQEEPDGTEDSAAEDQQPEDSASGDTQPGDTASEDAETGDPGPEAGNRSWRRRVVAGAIAAVTIGAVATAGYLGWLLWQQDQVSRAGEQAQAAAVQYAQILTSIDSAKVDENFDQVLDGATGEFKDMYSQSSVQLRQLLIDNKASAHGVVVDSAIQSESKDKVVVLLFVDQSVSNTSVPDPRIDRSRVKMTMEHVDGRWRASKVELP